MLDRFTNAQLIAAAIGLAIAVVISVVGYLIYRRGRTRGLRARFGAEYDRAVRTHGSSREAEVKLADRETRVKGLGLRDLAATLNGSAL